MEHAIVVALFACGVGPAAPLDRSRVLVFTKTAGYRHDSIPAGVAALVRMGEREGFRVEHTEEAARFDTAQLARYDVVIFLNTTGDVLNEAQQAALQRYVEDGGGWVGVHSAADTEYDWPWYGRLVGAYFASHPVIQRARLNVHDRTHHATRHLPATWERSDEWYNFRAAPADVNVLISIDETSYQGGTHGSNHPMAWYRSMGKGRAVYTALGHTAQSYEEANFLEHLRGAIRFAGSQGP